MSVLLLFSLNNPVAAQPGASVPGGNLTVKILTLNLHDGKDQNGGTNLAAARQFIAAQQPDLVLLQEVEAKQLPLLQPPGYHSDVGMNHNLFAYRFGNAILTNREVIYHHHYYLPSKLEQRGMDEIVLDVAGRSFMVVNTHLGLGNNERRRQLAEISRILGYYQGPVIIGGDFNTHPDDQRLAPLHDLFQEIGSQVSMPDTFPVSEPQERLDQIWFNANWQLKDAVVIPWEGSDHLPVMAKLELTEPSFNKAVPKEVPEAEPGNNPLLPQAGRTETRFGITTARRAEGNPLQGLLTLPITANLALTGVYDETGPSLVVHYRCAVFDLRDYISKWRNLRGQGEWTVSCGLKPGRRPRFNLEQYYRWNNQWGTRINAGASVFDESQPVSGGLEATWLSSDHLGVSLGLNTATGFTSGIDYTPDLKQAYALQLQAGNRPWRPALSWSLSD